MNNDKPMDQNEFWHSWYVLLATFWVLFFFLFNKKIVMNLPLLIMMIFFYFKNGLRLSTFVKILMIAMTSGIGFFLLLQLYPSAQYRDLIIGRLAGVTLYQKAFDRGLLVMGRLMCIATLSMCSGAVINYTKVFLHLMIHKGLKLFLGYPILLALNSIALFKSELERLRIIGKQRNLNFRDRMAFFFPLLVFAIRHSQRGALSLVTRGLNEEKSFYFSYNLRWRDRFFLLFFFLVYFILIALVIIR